MDIRKLRNRLGDAGLALVMVGGWDKAYGEGGPELRRALVLNDSRYEMVFLWRGKDSDDEVDYIVSRAKELLGGDADREKDRSHVPTVFHRAYDKLNYPPEWQEYVKTKRDEELAALVAKGL